jgi:superoxide reductase
MPRIFRSIDIQPEEKESKKDYFDRHTPHIFCPGEVKKGEKFMVKVKMGEEYVHPDDPDHYISYIQLWNRETFIAQVTFTPGALGNKPNHAEVDFYIVAPEVSMNLSAMSNCTKHGLWMSDPKTITVV